MENECEALPGVAYAGVRDNRSTINTKTGYDMMILLVLHDVCHLIKGLLLVCYTILKVAFRSHASHSVESSSRVLCAFRCVYSWNFISSTNITDRPRDAPSIGHFDKSLKVTQDHSKLHLRVRRA